MDAKSAGRKLAELRRERGLTKRQVARDLGASYQSVCAWEYGDRAPRDDMKVRLANYYCASVESIFFEANNYET